jgi:hypothetical protein
VDIGGSHLAFKTSSAYEMVRIETLNNAVGSVVEILREYDDQAKFGVDAWLPNPTSDSRVH